MKLLKYAAFVLVFWIGVSHAQAQDFSRQVLYKNNVLLFLAGDGERENEGAKSGNREDSRDHGRQDRGKGEREDRLQKKEQHDGEDRHKKEREKEREREDSQNMKNDRGLGNARIAQRFFIAEPETPRSDVQHENEAGFIFGSGD